MLRARLLATLRMCDGKRQQDRYINLSETDWLVATTITTRKQISNEQQNKDKNL